jgi:hypothetical protein
MDPVDLNQYFEYHAPNFGQIDRMNEIRNAAKELAHIITQNCPSSADRSAAIRKLRECVMTANVAIVLEDK